ncbi:hypothetical protein [Methylobacterium ajmalii]|uniref:hypothetical protein n=1 Tax=Methylobacterium ajmalii TaxID=2738439 RepID=UPI002F360C9F
MTADPADRALGAWCTGILAIGILNAVWHGYALYMDHEMQAGMIFTAKVLVGIAAIYALLAGLFNLFWHGPSWLTGIVFISMIVAVIIAAGGVIGAAFGF